MAEHHLDHPEVRPAFQQVAGKRVAQHVWVQIRAAELASGQLLQPVLDRTRADPTASATGEQRRGVRIARSRM